MSIKVLVYAPSLSNDLLPRIARRFADLGMECQFDPGFMLDPPGDSGWVRIRLRVISSHLPQYAADMLSRFEIAFKDFRYNSPLSVNPAINERLKPCTRVVTLRMHATPTCALRAGMYFAALLAEVTNGVMYTPRSDQYLAPAQALEQAAQEIASYEDELSPQDFNVVPFEAWP